MSEPFQGFRRWVVERDEKSVVLKLTSPRGSYEALSLDPVVPDFALVEWLVQHGEPLPGDEILTPAELLQWGGERLRLIWTTLPDGRQIFQSEIGRA